jgi:hypothetical protein
MKEIYEVANTEGFSISRYGITLDWTMGYPPDQRKEGQKGLVLFSMNQMILLG